MAYRENFPNDTSANYGIADDPRGGRSGWQSNFGATGVTHKRDPNSANGDAFRGELMCYEGNSHWAMLSKITGVRRNLPPVNSNPQLPARNRGGFYFEDLCLGPSHANDDLIVPHNALMWTDECTISRSLCRVDKLRWYQGNRNVAGRDHVRVAIRIGRAWFASEAVFTNGKVLTGADFAGKARLMTLKFAHARWRTLDFEPDARLALGSPAPLPDGDITAFGLYVDNARDKLRFDMFEVCVRPAP